MKRLKAGAIALILCLHAPPARTAVPEFGTPEGELSCVALVGVAVTGAEALQPPKPGLVQAMAIAFGFYLGRLSKVDPDATKQDVDRAMAKLTLEDQNSYVNLCLKKAGELMGPTLK